MSKAYMCYDLVSRHLYHSLDVTFFEDIPFFLFFLFFFISK
jgi:hypothetical protein